MDKKVKKDLNAKVGVTRIYKSEETKDLDIRKFYEELKKRNGTT